MAGSSPHTRYKCQYHVVFIPKYRKRIMYGKIKADVREVLKQLCSYRKIEIVEGAVCADHVHLCLNIPPSEKVCDVVAYLKGKSAL
ncbi:MAG: IS200/IS605 family transposase, partial [Lachnospiraceae bacterium]